MARQSTNEDNLPPVYTPEYPSMEEEWRTLLEEMDRCAKDVRASEKGTIESRKQEQKLVAAMIRVAEVHPCPKGREEWANKVKEYQFATPEEKSGVLEDIGKGVGILLLTPFAIVAGALFAVGAVLYGAGSVVAGLGNLLTLGELRSRRR